MITDLSFVKSNLPPIAEDANKYTKGYGVIFAGSYPMAGAALLCAKAALKSGAGIIRLVTDERIYPVCAGALPEAVYTLTGDKDIELSEVPLDKCNAIAFGCGMGQSRKVWAVLKKLLEQSTKPLLIDADGINVLSGHIDVLKHKSCPVVLTPHEGEMARLIGKSSDYVRLNRSTVASAFAKEYKVTLLLKGKNTVIADCDGRQTVNPTGSCALATAGSGDVLSGIITALMCQGAKPFEAAAVGAYVHGLSGEAAQKHLGLRSVTATEIIEYLPKAFKEC